MKKSQQPNRQLAAVVFTDIVGYTRMMGENEDKALRVLAKNRAIHKRFVAENNGTWLKEMGDGTLLSFHSAFDAVNCAYQIRELVLEESDFDVRIGIHLGDVTFVVGDVFGDGVNIASRLQSAAEPNDIFISEAVFDNIKNIPGVEASFFEQLNLKNVSEPVNVYKVQGHPDISVADRDRILQDMRSINYPRKTTAVYWVIGFIILAAIAFTSYRFNFLGFGVDKSVKSLAIIPFEYRGANKKEFEYISHGLTDDILLKLVKIKDLKVVHQSIQNPEDQSIKSLGEILGVNYILKGSVQKEGEDLKVNAQLFKTDDTEEFIWGDTWEKSYTDILKIQQEVPVAIATAMEVNLTEEEEYQISELPTNSFSAYDLYLKGREYYSRLTEQSNDDAQKLFLEALKIDPNFTLAHAGLSDVYSQKAQRSYLKSPWIDSAFHHATLVKQDQPNSSSGYKSMGLYYSIQGDTENAIREFEKAVNIDQNIEAVINLSRLYYQTGELQNSLNLLDEVIDSHPVNENLFFNYGETYFRLGMLQRAEENYNHALLINSGHVMSLLSKWIIAVIEDRTDEAHIIGNRIGDIAGLDTGSILLILQFEIQENTHDIQAAAQRLISLIAERELDYIELPYLYNLICSIYYRGGFVEEANELMNTKLSINQSKISKGGLPYRFSYEIAQIYAILDQEKLALKSLEQSFENGWLEIEYMYRDPALRGLRQNADLNHIIERAAKRRANIMGKEPNPKSNLSI